MEDGNQQPDFVRISDDFMEVGKQNTVMKLLENRLVGVAEFVANNCC